MSGEAPLAGVTNMLSAKHPPPLDRKITAKYNNQWFVVEWVEDRSCWVTSSDQVRVPFPEEWIRYEVFVIEYHDPDPNRVVKQEFILLDQAIDQIKFLARTGTKITLYQEEG